MPNENLTPRENTSPTPTPPTPPAAPQTPIVPPQVPVDTTMKMPAGVTVEEETKPPYVAILLGVLVLLVAIALGGLYLWGSMIVKEAADEDVSATSAATSTPEEESQAAPSDSIESIEADLESEDFESIDAELDAIDAEIEGSATTTP